MRSRKFAIKRLLFLSIKIKNFYLLLYKGDSGILRTHFVHTGASMRELFLIRLDTVEIGKLKIETGTFERWIQSHLTTRLRGQPLGVSENLCLGLD
jgi:hypothetical protein